MARLTPPLAEFRQAPLCERLSKLREPSQSVDPRIFDFSDRLILREMSARIEPHRLVLETVLRLGLDFDEALSGFFQRSVEVYDAAKSANKVQAPDAEYYGTLLGQGVAALDSVIEDHYGGVYAYVTEHAQHFGAFLLEQSCEPAGLQEAS